MAKEKAALKKRIRCQKFVSKPPEVVEALIKALSEPTKTLVETFLFAAHLFAEVGLLYCWEELFELSAENVYERDRGPPQICFDRCTLANETARPPTGHLSEHFFSSYIPQHLQKRLLRLSKSNKGGLLFTLNGKSFTAVLLYREFEKTGLLIRPLDLRVAAEANPDFLPIFPKRLSESQVQKIERDVLSYKTNAGRPRQVPLKDILEEVLYREVNGSWSRSPHVKAAKSRKRKWKDDGKLTEILNYIEKNCWEEPCNYGVKKIE